LRSQERIGCREGSIQARSLRTPLLAGNDPLRILWGSHADWFDRPAFLEQGWVVTPLSNRIGLRLRRESVAPMTNFPMTNDQKRPGLVIGHWEIGSFPELVSEPVCPGTMQVTPDGQCVILGVDGQTIGGYPRLAHVISADLDRVGQLRPGQQIRFQPVTLEEAEEIFYTQQQEQKSLLHRIALAAIWPTGRELLS
jgi:allophanate hydrolase subunit 2